jgi:transcription initiation factor TFIIIB Brf1 subunit/transcription initiation factor TFIIB
MAANTSNITCKQCGYVNEGERVYCHSCGTKLDRSLLPSESQPESTQKEQKRIRKMVAPSRGFFASGGKKLAATLLWAVLVAGTIEIARPPEGAPPLPKKGEFVDTPPIRMVLENLLHAPGPRKLVLKEADINAYLKNSVKAKSAGLIGDEVKFMRAYVKLNEGEIRITTQQSLFDYPLYGTIYYQLAIRDNTLQATCTGGNFGRLPVDPRLMKYLDIVFKQLWGALAPDKKLLDRAQSVDVHKDFIEVVSKPVPQ